MTLQNETELKQRFCACGPLYQDIHLIDLFLYDSSLFANVMLVQDTRTLTIVDTGSSKTIGAILNYLNFNQIEFDNVVIIPTHHHFDHIGGLNPLLSYFEKKSVKTTVLATKPMITAIQNIIEYEKAAKKGFHETVGELTPINVNNFQIVTDNEEITLGDEWTVKIVETPGHCDDHLSPIFQNRAAEKIAFFGESLGINLKNDLYPIPASSSPGFNSKKYVQSIKKIEDQRPDLGFFAHFGGVRGVSNVIQTCHNALWQLQEFRKTIQMLYNINPQTASISKLMFERYEDYLATLSLNKELAKNLAFTIVYGFLQDMGLKAKK